jgi:SNF2 family DNA or RNA helicase
MPKSALIKDNEVKNVQIEYDKYNHIDLRWNTKKKQSKNLVRNKKFILADDMGLGKTTATIIAALRDRS